MAVFELRPIQKKTEHVYGKGLGSTLLLDNGRWFTKVRWAVIIIFAFLGLFGVTFPGLLQGMGIRPPGIWPWYLSGVLLLMNILFSLWVNRLAENSSRGAIEINLWLQIIVDLLVVTVMVHEVGSTVTFIAFTYLFHIAIACIFFPPAKSLLVTLIASFLYLVCVDLETRGVWPPTSILLTTPHHLNDGKLIPIMFALSAVFIWLVVWYFVSALSAKLQQRDRQLSQANYELIRANQEKTKQVIVTTHELKAPFVGIESHIQVLKYQYWDKLPDPVKQIIDKIEVRAQTLRDRIRKILLLGELKSAGVQKKKTENVDLKSLLDKILDDINAKAEERQINLDIQIPSVTLWGNKEDYSLLLSNIIANALSYSHEGGSVAIKGEVKNKELLFSVADQGIGIREDALPHVFEEYFQTREASKFNKISTGLGLAIVKEVTQHYGLRLKVISEEGKGTVFQIAFPMASLPKEEEKNGNHKNYR